MWGPCSTSMRRLSLISIFLCLCLLNAKGQDIPALQIDTNYVKTFKILNDYSILGVQYGVGFSIPNLQPTRNTKMTIEPVNIGIMYTRYGKLFGYMPYFGIQMGAFYNQENLQFETLENGYTDHILGASKYDYKVIEVPVMAHLHYDFWKMKIMVNVGVFGGYRLAIARSNYTSEKNFEQYGEYQNKFHKVENRFDYGLRAGAGLGLMLDPIELHFMVWYKLSWMNLHQPNMDRFYNESKYYYYWSYPSSINVSVGIHYQLSKRHGKTRKAIREQAKEDVMEMVKQAKAAADSLCAPKMQTDSLSTPKDSLMLGGRELKKETVE